MRFGSLFSGIGGLDLGLERAGMECAWQVEIDEWCRRVLARHWPDVPRWDDAKTFPPDTYRGRLTQQSERNGEAGSWWPSFRDDPKRLAVDLICGGFPCQPVSHAGKRLAQADERWLWPEFARIVRVLRPRYVLVENVPGLLSRGMGDVLGDLAASGYDTEWDCIPAAAVGAPHLRYRVFIVAYANGEGLEGRGVRGAVGNGRLSLTASEGRRPARSIFPGTPGGARALGIAARSDWWAVEPDVGRVAARLSPRLDGGLDAHPGCIEKAGTKGIPQTNRLRVLREYLQTSAASSEPPRCSLCGHPLSALPCQGACLPWNLGSRGEEAEDLRCLQEGVLGLLTHQGQDVQPFLSLGAWSNQREQAVGDRVNRLRGLGNAVVPQVAEWIGRRLMELEA